MDNADCLQPTAAAKALCESFAARRASLILKQTFGLSLVTGSIMDFILSTYKGENINIINIFINI